MDPAELAMAAARCSTLYVRHDGRILPSLAATYPERTEALILASTLASGVQTEDYPWALSLEQHERFLDRVEQSWGTGFSAELFSSAARFSTPEYMTLRRSTRLRRSLERPCWPLR